MTVLAALMAGAVVGFAALVVAGDLFSAPVFLRTNYRGRRVPVGVGALIPLTTVVVLSGLVIARRAGGWESSSELISGELAVLVAVLGLAFLGLVDDLAATGDTRGFRGHLGSILRGTLTTGAVKLVGGGLVGIYVASMLHPDTTWAIVLADGALIALAANAGNLFDRAPGRCTKVSALSFVLVAGATGAPEDLTGAAVVIGAGIGLIGADLAERIMLGDAGANALGGAVGVAVVTTLPTAGRLVALVVLVALNAASERVSFSEVIERNRVMRYVDRLGRRDT